MTELYHLIRWSYAAYIQEEGQVEELLGYLKLRWSNVNARHQRRTLLARPLDAFVRCYVSRVYFTSSISPGRQVLSNHASVGL